MEVGDDKKVKESGEIREGNGKERNVYVPKFVDLVLHLQMLSSNISATEQETSVSKIQYSERTTHSE